MRKETRIEKHFAYVLSIALFLIGITLTLIPLNHREQNDGRKPSFLRVEQELKE